MRIGVFVQKAFDLNTTKPVAQLNRMNELFRSHWLTKSRFPGFPRDRHMRPGVRENYKDQRRDYYTWKRWANETTRPVVIEHEPHLRIIQSKYGSR